MCHILLLYLTSDSVHWYAIILLHRKQCNIFRTTNIFQRKGQLKVVEEVQKTRIKVSQTCIGLTVTDRSSCIDCVLTTKQRTVCLGEGGSLPECSCPVLHDCVFTYAFMAYLLIKLIDDAFCPFEVQVTGFGRSVDVCKLNADLAH